MRQSIRRVGFLAVANLAAKLILGRGFDGDNIDRVHPTQRLLILMESISVAIEREKTDAAYIANVSGDKVNNDRQRVKIYSLVIQDVSQNYYQ